MIVVDFYSIRTEKIPPYRREELLVVGMIAITVEVISIPEPSIRIRELPFR